MYGIFTYIWLKFMVDVGKYTSPMDPMGISHLQALGSLGIPMNQAFDVSNRKNLEPRLKNAWAMNSQGPWHIFEQINPIL